MTNGDRFDAAPPALSMGCSTHASVVRLTRPPGPQPDLALDSAVHHLGTPRAPSFTTSLAPPGARGAPAQLREQDCLAAAPYRNAMIYALSEPTIAASAMSCTLSERIRMTSTHSSQRRVATSPASALSCAFPAPTCHQAIAAPRSPDSRVLAAAASPPFSWRTQPAPVATSA